MAYISQADIRRLREVRRYATMELASFGGISSSEPDPTAFIRETTRLWRETWIIGPLDTLLAKLDTK